MNLIHKPQTRYGQSEWQNRTALGKALLPLELAATVLTLYPPTGILVVAAAAAVLGVKGGRK